MAESEKELKSLLMKVKMDSSGSHSRTGLQIARKQSRDMTAERKKSVVPRRK